MFFFEYSLRTRTFRTTIGTEGDGGGGGGAKLPPLATSLQLTDKHGRFLPSLNPHHLPGQLTTDICTYLERQGP
jgi:hypothetical protein